MLRNPEGFDEYKKFYCEICGENRSIGRCSRYEQERYTIYRCEYCSCAYFLIEPPKIFESRLHVNGFPSSCLTCFAHFPSRRQLQKHLRENVDHQV